MNNRIEVTTHVARDFLQNAAYFNTVPKVVWEYVSNSVDNPKQGQPVSVEVKITKERIIISDNGNGMSREGLRNFFQMHALNIRRGLGQSVRGRYGTGKCAALGIADSLRIETVQNYLLNIVELSRKNIEQSSSGNPFPVIDIVVNKSTTEVDGTRVIISKLNIKSVEIPATIAYIEHHLGRQLQNHLVVINEHVCEYQEPYSVFQRIFDPSSKIAEIIGDVSLTVKVSPIPLERENAGIDILSKGIWHDTTVGSLEGETSKRIFGEVDVPILEEKYEEQKIPPFDNTRNMSLNLSNPLVATLLGWIDQCLGQISQELNQQEKERKATEEAKRLEKQARQLEKILNDDFKNLQLELERVRRTASVQNDKGGIEEPVPGIGDVPTEYGSGGPEHGNGGKGDVAGAGEVTRPGTGLLNGQDSGQLGKVTERKQRQSIFHVEYRHEESSSPRSHYDVDIRVITINLDHPQIVRALNEGGNFESKQFKEITFEIAFVEYSIALGQERLNHDPFYQASSAFFDLRETLNRVSRFLYT